VGGEEEALQQPVRRREAAEGARPPAGAEADPTPEPPRRQPELSEEELWSVAIDGARPLSDRSERIRPGPQPLSVPSVELDPDLEAYDELRALVTGEIPFDIADSDEFIEGHSEAWIPASSGSCEKESFAVQAHVDLHGLLKDEAKAALEAFLARSRQDGKALRPGGPRPRPALERPGAGAQGSVEAVDAHRPLRPARARFSSARPHDGGTGAM